MTERYDSIKMTLVKWIVCDAADVPDHVGHIVDGRYGSTTFDNEAEAYRCLAFPLDPTVTWVIVRVQTTYDFSVV